MATVITFPIERIRPSGQAAAEPSPWKVLGVIFVGLLAVEGVRYWAGVDTQPVFLPREPSRIGRRRR